MIHLALEGLWKTSVNLQHPACGGSKYYLDLFSPPIANLVSVVPSGAVLAAATYPAAAQRHGAARSKSFRWGGQHSNTRSAPQEAQGALTTCRQPGEDLNVCICALFIFSHDN